MSSIFFIALFFGLIYFLPTSETMVCNENYVCKVEHNFLFGIKKVETIELKPTSFLNVERNVINYKHISGQTKILIYDSSNRLVQPFIYYVYKDNGYGSGERNSELFFREQNQKFLRYLKKPNEGYTISSLAKKENIYLCSIFLILIYIFYNFTLWLSNKID